MKSCLKTPSISPPLGSRIVLSVWQSLIRHLLLIQLQSGIFLYKSRYENLPMHFMLRRRMLTRENTMPWGWHGDKGDYLFHTKQQMNIATHFISVWLLPTVRAEFSITEFGGKEDLRCNLSQTPLLVSEETSAHGRRGFCPSPCS